MVITSQRFLTNRSCRSFAISSENKSSRSKTGTQHHHRRSEVPPRRKIHLRPRLFLHSTSDSVTKWCPSRRCPQYPTPSKTHQPPPNLLRNPASRLRSPDRHSNPIRNDLSSVPGLQWSICCDLGMECVGKVNEGWFWYRFGYSGPNLSEDS